MNKKPQEIKQLTQKRTFGTQTEAPPAEEKKDESKEEAQKPANMSSQAPHPALSHPSFTTAPYNHSQISCTPH